MGVNNRSSQPEAAVAIRVFGCDGAIGKEGLSLATADSDAGTPTNGAQINLLTRFLLLYQFLGMTNLRIFSSFLCFLLSELKKKKKTYLSLIIFYLSSTSHWKRLKMAMMTAQAHRCLWDVCGRE